LPQPKANELAPVDRQDDLRDLVVDGVNLGLGVLADTIGTHGYVFDTKKHYGYMKKVFAAELQLLTTLLGLNVGAEDCLVIFNGRLSLSRTLVEFCKARQLEFVTHERTGVQQRYRVRHNTLPHDIDQTTIEMNEAWDGSEQQRTVASSWFNERRSGIEQSWLSFTKTQDEGKLPVGFDPARRNIAIFNSTIEEYETIEGWKGNLFEDDAKAIQILYERYQNWEGFHFYLRLHPNLKRFATGPQMKAILSFPVPANFTLILPEDTVHSYALMDACEKVVVFGSTIGIESVYWGKPTIQLGNSLYMNLGVTFRPESLDQLDRLLNDRLEPFPADGALPYAFWEAGTGTSHKFFRPTGVVSGEFLGKPRRPVWMLRFLNRIEGLRLLSRDRKVKGRSSVVQTP